MLKRTLYRIFAIAYSVMGRERVVFFFFQMVQCVTRKISAQEALHFLLELDRRLYFLQGQEAVRYGDGLHTKHRHMNYHDFFTDRIDVDESILDVGCGNGALAHDIATKCAARVTAVDISEENIILAQERYSSPNTTFVIGDANNKLPEDHFDTVVLSNILEHLEDRVGFLLQLQEKVTPRRFLVRVPLFERDWRVPLKKELGVEWRLDPTHFIEYTQESFLEEVRRARLKVGDLEIRWGEIWSELWPLHI